MAMRFGNMEIEEKTFKEKVERVVGTLYYREG